MSDTLGNSAWYMTDAGWAAAEIGRKIDLQYGFIDRSVARMAVPKDDETCEDLLQIETRQQRMAKILERDGRTLSELYVVQERVEAGDEAAVEEWVMLHSTKWHEVASPYDTFDETDY
jgi:hypothetical protein